MRSFKQFLLETPLQITYYDKESHSIDTTDRMLKAKQPKKVVQKSTRLEYDHVGSTKTHNIYRWHDKDSYDINNVDGGFAAVDKKTKRIHMSVNGIFTPITKKFEVTDLKGNPKSTIKAHDFYHHLLIAGHVKKLVSDKTQSIGGRKVWQKLSQLPHVKMSAQGYAGKTKDIFNKKISYHKDFDKNYTTGLGDPDPVYAQNAHKQLVAKVKY